MVAEHDELEVLGSAGAYGEPGQAGDEAVQNADTAGQHRPVFPLVRSAPTTEYSAPTGIASLEQLQRATLAVNNGPLDSSCLEQISAIQDELTTQTVGLVWTAPAPSVSVERVRGVL